MSENKQVLSNWRDYTAVKKWKKGLVYGSHRQRMSPKTEQAIENYMPLFLEYTQKTPDAIIEEALAGKHVVKERLSDFFNWMQDEKGKTFYTSLHASYRIIRGFYSHNDINTQKIKAPKPDPSQVEFSDDAVPLFHIIEIEENGETVKKKELRKEFLKDFFECLSPRDKLIALCLKDCGLDSGDLLNLPLYLVRLQDQNSQRIFIKYTRQKTKEIVCTFFTKETTKLLKNYVSLNRKDAVDSEPIFVESKSEFRRRFSKENKRKFDPERDIINVQAIDPHSLARNFRNAASRFEKILASKNEPCQFLRFSKQSPLRPKRFRKLFNDVCDACGVPTDIKRVFMGKSDPSNKAYEGKSRMDLEIYYESVDQRLTLYSNPISLPTKELQELKQQLKISEQEKEDMQKQNNIKQQENDRRFDRLERLIDEKWESSKKDTNS